MQNEGYEVLPSNIGLQDVNLAAAINRYNEVLVERKRLLRTSTENNPTIVNLDTSIRAMKANVQATLEAGKTYQIEVVAVGDDENATEYAAAELSVTTKSEDNGSGGDNGNTGDNGNNGNNGNAGVNNPTKDQNHNAGTTNKKQNAAAKTGDSTNMAVFVFMLGGSLAAGTVVFRRKRR